MPYNYLYIMYELSCLMRYDLYTRPLCVTDNNMANVVLNKECSILRVTVTLPTI